MSAHELGWTRQKLAEAEAEVQRWTQLVEMYRIHLAELEGEGEAPRCAILKSLEARLRPTPWKPPPPRRPPKKHKTTRTTPIIEEVE